jgi:DNA polymerase-1
MRVRLTGRAGLALQATFLSIPPPGVRAFAHGFYPMSESHRDLLILIDGSSYLYRAYHALPPLSNSRGEPSGAIYGVVNMLRRMLAEQDSERIAVVFDARGKTFRDELFTEYKANRPAMPEDLGAQVEPLRAIVRALGLPVLEVPGVEADDVIGTLAKRAAGAGMQTLISTGDKDMAQLVSERITLVNTMSNTVLDPPGVREKFGVAPEQIVDYLSLVGDSSDNIPGVPKVGPKTAAKWLAEHRSLEGLIAKASEIKGKVGESLRNSLEQLPLARQLATIRCDLDLELDPRKLKRKPPEREELQKWFKRLEFASWLAQLAEEAGAQDAPAGEVSGATTAFAVETVLTGAQLEAWLEQLRSAEVFAFDTETTSLDYMLAEVVGVSFAVSPNAGAYVPLAHSYRGAPAQLDRDTVLERLRPLLQDPGRAKLGQNLKYDMSVLANHGVRLEGIRYDTMLESYVLNSTATRHDMDALALKYLGYRTIHYEDVAGKGSRQLRFDQVPIEEAARYAAEDAVVTLRLHQSLWPRLQAETGLETLFEQIEVPLVPVLSRLERNGVLIDGAMLAAQSLELAERMAQIEEECFAVAGTRFNLASPKQIQEILFEQLRLPVRQKTPKGQPSTAESALQELALDYPLPRLILDHRALSKLRSTYTERLPQQVSPRTGRVHTSYHQAVAATGRLSSSDPNLQNIPARKGEGRRIRRAFVAPPGRAILAADYSQIELRIMAHLSGDEGLRQAFAAGKDVHRATAAEVFGVAPEEVSDQQRRSAKAINFGLIYGMSAFGLARQLGVERGAAQAYVDRYFEHYPGVRAYMERTREEAGSRGYVETLFRRRLHLPEIKSSNKQRRQYAERTAINAPMQGSAADIIKRAMLAVDAWLQKSGADAPMIMQVHDELVFEVAQDQVAQVGEEILTRMVGAADLSVPLIVDVGTGQNWDEAH